MKKAAKKTSQKSKSTPSPVAQRTATQRADRQPRASGAQPTVAQNAKRVQTLIALFERYNPNPKCALNHSTPEELLVATILSAQCTDERVNIVTKTLFKKYKNMKAFADADLAELEQDVRSTGFYKNKARNIKNCATDICAKYGGKVPRDLGQLVELAGVGRKTANVVLGNAFGIASGIVVDTHVTRLSHRLDLSRANSAEKIEEDLVQIVDKPHWVNFSHWLILHGRAVCKARKPACPTCYLQEHCPKRL